jgi:hypothetical protein
MICTEKNLYLKKSSRVNCLFWAKKAIQKKAAAFFGPIRQVQKGSQNSLRDQKQYLNIRIFIRPSHFFHFFKNGQTRLKNICATSLNYTRLENGFNLGLKKAIYVRSRTR